MKYRAPLPYEPSEAPTSAPSDALARGASAMLERTLGPVDAPYHAPVTSTIAPVGDLRRGRDGVERRLIEGGVPAAQARADAIAAATEAERSRGY